MNVQDLMNKLARGLTEGKISATDEVHFYCDELRDSIIAESVAVHREMIAGKQHIVISN